jgi:ribosomal protein S18 acetylase RimI-like enzyme
MGSRKPPSLPEIEIRRLLDSDWMGFRELRLAALRTDPLAFGSTIELEQAYRDGRWQEWAHGGATGERQATFVAINPANQLVGMCGTFSEDARFMIWGLWVHPSQRGRGIGGRLLDAVLGWIDAAFPGSSTVLDVNPVQGEALRLYLKRGFTYDGEARPLGHHPPAMRRQMVRRFAPPVA